MNLEKNSYGSLYRKCRPKLFSDIIGQQHIVEALKRQVASGNVTHAYLFSGSRGTGKTSTALVLAKAINCLNPQEGEPCLMCENCLSQNIDVIEMDAASHNSVDDIRELRELVKYSPARGKKKIYIIDEVHMLSHSAFNALLKTLEEPPSHIVFILATTELHMIPSTVQSRCQRFDFKRISRAGMREKISDISKSYGVRIDDSAVELMLRIADGSMRDALALLEQSFSLEADHLTEDAVAEFFGTARAVDLIRIVHDTLASDMISLISVLKRLFEVGVDVSELISGLILVLRDLIVLTVSGRDDSVKGTDTYRHELSKLTREKGAEELFTKLVDLSKFMRYSKNKENILEITLISFAMDRVKVCGAISQKVSIGQTEAKEPENTESPLPEDVGVSFSKETEQESRKQGEFFGGENASQCLMETENSIEIQDEPLEKPGEDSVERENENPVELGKENFPESSDEQPQGSSDIPAKSTFEEESDAEKDDFTKRYTPNIRPTTEHEEEKRSPRELDELWENIVNKIPEEKRTLLRHSHIGLIAGGEVIVHVKGLSKARAMVVEMKVKADVVEAAKQFLGRDCTVKFEAVEKTSQERKADQEHVKKYFEERGLSIEIK